MKKLITALASALGYRPQQSFTLSAVVTRADGTAEDLGVVAHGRARFTPQGSAGTLPPNQS